MQAPSRLVVPASLQLAPQDLESRVAVTVELLQRRGYALPPHRLAAILHRGPAHAQDVVHAAQTLGLSIDQGLVHPPGADLQASLARQRMHDVASQAYRPAFHSYLRRLRRTCPWIEAALLAGSMASGGFTHEDDIDLDFLVADGTKHTTYLAAILLSLPEAWQTRKRAGRADTPFVRKLVCVNLVLERGQTRPLARQDADLAFELALSRPLWGAQTFRETLRANPELVGHFPQMMLLDAPEVVPQARGGVLAALVRRTWSRRCLEAVSYRIVVLLHAAVRWHRRKDPEALEHAARMESYKRPYGSLERP